MKNTSLVEELMGNIHPHDDSPEEISREHHGPKLYVLLFFGIHPESGLDIGPSVSVVHHEIDFSLDPLVSFSFGNNTHVNR